MVGLSEVITNYVIFILKRMWACCEAWSDVWSIFDISCSNPYFSFKNITNSIITCIYKLWIRIFLHSRSLRLCISSVWFLSSSSSSSVNTSKSYISDMTWPILTRLGHKYRLTIPFMSHDQIRVKGHVGVTGVKKVIFTKNATPTNYVAWSCNLCMW